MPKVSCSWDVRSAKASHWPTLFPAWPGSCVRTTHGASQINRSCPTNWPTTRDPLIPVASPTLNCPTVQAASRIVDVGPEKALHASDATLIHSRAPWHYFRTAFEGAIGPPQTSL